MYYFLLFFLFISNFIFSNNSEYFQQEVNYTINVTLDDKEHELNGNIEIEYINNSPDNLKEIFFHLWPNAYQDHCTALCKQKIRNKKINLYYANKNDRGYIDNLNFHINGDPIKYELDQNNKDICKLILEPNLVAAALLNSAFIFSKLPKSLFIASIKSPLGSPPPLGLSIDQNKR